MSADPNRAAPGLSTGSDANTDTTDNDNDNDNGGGGTDKTQLTIIIVSVFILFIILIILRCLCVILKGRKKKQRQNQQNQRPNQFQHQQQQYNRGGGQQVYTINDMPISSVHPSGIGPRSVSANPSAPTAWGGDQGGVELGPLGVPKRQRSRQPPRRLPSRTYGQATPAQSDYNSYGMQPHSHANARPDFGRTVSSPAERLGPNGPRPISNVNKQLPLREMTVLEDIDETEY